MIRSYFLVAWRNLLRDKTFSAINILGLAIGMAVVFLIYQYVQAERTYDSFHAKAARIYRLPLSYSGTFASSRPSAANHPALGPALKNDFPEVEDFTRLVRASLLVPATTVAYEKAGHQPMIFNEEKIYFADASFMTMFSFPMTEGDRASALREPKSIVITQAVAKKYFGNEPAIGKILLLNNLACTVTGILEPVPANSHLQFDMLVSFSSLGDKFGYDNWRWPEFYNYVLLAPDASASALEAKFPAFMEKYLGSLWREYNFKSHLSLQPITDIHLNSNLALEQSPNGSSRTVYFLTLLGIFVLVIAWINYINLSTAKSLERAKEVGLRKVSGASRKQLVAQFFVDAALVNAAALVFAVLIVTVTAPYFEQLAGRNIAAILISTGQWYSVSFWGIAAGTFFTGILAVGLYPAVLLSSFNPAQVLKGKFLKSSSGIWLRKSLVGFQYCLSLFLLAGMITITSQLNFMQNQDLGYQQNQRLVVRGAAIFDSTYSRQIRFFEETLRRQSSVKELAKSGEIPGYALPGRNNVRRTNQGAEENISAFMVDVDDHFLNTYGMSLAAGRNFNEQERFRFSSLPTFSMQNLAFDFKNSTPPEQINRVLINEELAQRLGFSDPEAALHQQILFRTWDNFTAEVVGVVKNYHQQSLKENYDPIVYIFPSYDSWLYFTVQLGSGDLPAAIARIKAAYAAAFPGNAFEYYFLDDNFNLQYQADQKFAGIFKIFTVLAVVIACLGLLGLGLFSVSQRMKEIGVRKVLGATELSILLLFSRDTIRLLLISAVIAFPVIFLAARKWLTNFAFHIDVQWQMFLVPLAVLLVISVTTMTIVSLRTAAISPSVSLKND